MRWTFLSFLFFLLLLGSVNSIHQSGDIVALSGQSVYFKQTAADDFKVCTYPTANYLTVPSMDVETCNFGKGPCQIGVSNFYFGNTNRNSFYLNSSTGCLTTSPTDSGADFHSGNRICPFKHGFSSMGTTKHWSSGGTRFIDVSGAKLSCSGNTNINFQIELRSVSGSFDSIVFHFGTLNRGNSGCQPLDELSGINYGSTTSTSFVLSNRVPSNLQAISFAQKMYLKWTGYAFDFGTYRISNPGSIDVTGANTVITGLTTGQSYTFQIQPTCQKPDGTPVIGQSENFPVATTTSRTLEPPYSEKMDDRTTVQLVFNVVTPGGGFSVGSYMSPGGTFNFANKVNPTTATNVLHTYSSLNSGQYTWAGFLKYDNVEEDQAYWVSLTTATLYPTEPTSATWTGSTHNSLQFSFTPSTVADSHVAQYYLGGNLVGSKAAITSPFTITGLQSAGTYEVRIFGAGGSTLSASYSSISGTTRPGLVTNLVMTSFKNKVRISFSPPTGATTYQYKLGSGSWVVFSGSPQEIEALTPATNYAISVRSGADNGVDSNNRYSTQSATVSGYTYPLDVTDLEFNFLYALSFQIQWNPVSGATHYRVRITNVDTMETTYSDPLTGSQYYTSSTPNTNYRLIVQSGIQNNFDPSGPELIFKTKPPEVTGAQYALTSPTSFSVSWTAAPGATIYRLRLYRQGGFLTGTVYINTTSHHFLSVTTYETYSVEISPGNDDGYNEANPTNINNIIPLPSSGCAANKYLSNGICVNCPEHSSSPAGSWSIENCVCEGNYEMIDGSCKCAANYYNTGGNCFACPAYSTSPAGSDSQSDCVCAPTLDNLGGFPCGCAANKYQVDATCVACPTHSTSPIRSDNILDCVCATDFTLFESTCVCIANHYYGSGKCNDCPAYSTSPQGSDDISDCLCNEGFTRQGNTCVCIAGTYLNNGKCTSCPAYSTSPQGSTSKSACTCIGDFVGPAGGPCECPANSYLSNDACVSCPMYSTSSKGSTSIDHCVCQTPFIKHNNLCTCPADSYFQADGCVSCPAKSHSPVNSDGLEDCVCDGTYEMISGKCQCPANKYESGSACYNCFEFSTSPPGSTSVSDCVCNIGHAPPTCDNCVVGYHAASSGNKTCVEDKECSPPNCNGRGSCNGFNGICFCGSNFDPATGCATCASGYYLDGENCKESKVCSPACGSGGYCDPAVGKCVCDTENMDNTCKQCTGNGKFGPFPVCNQCNTGYHGNYPDCKVNVPCSDPSCSGKGTCNLDTGKCICDHLNWNQDCSGCINEYHSGYPGDCFPLINCTDHCNTFGTCNNGTCNCYDGYIGDTCGECAAGYYGYPDCYELKTCDCSIHGACNNRTGLCSCLSNWRGENCDICQVGYKNEEEGCWKIFSCNVTCIHGKCNEKTGSCNCEERWSGVNCNSYDNCGVNPCQNGGVCSSTGNNVGDYDCSCSSAWWGKNCTTPNLVPEVYGVQPTILSRNGGPVTVQGKNFQSGLKVHFLHGKEFVQEVIVYTIVEKDSRRAGTQEFTFVVPIVETDGAMSFRIVNPGGAESIYSGFYVTNDCPVAGVYGKSGNCLPCPSCGFCPGGNRIYPLDGCWSPNDATVPIPCEGKLTPDRCIGGENHRCLIGYEGEQCAVCSEGYQLSKDKTTCEDCGTDCTAAGSVKGGIGSGAIAGIIVVLLLVFIVVVVAGIYYYRSRFYNRKNVEDELADMDTKFFDEELQPVNYSTQALVTDADKRSSYSSPPPAEPPAVAAAPVPVSAPIPQPVNEELLRKRERLSNYEVEGFCISRITHFLMTNEGLVKQFQNHPQRFLIVARIAYRLTKAVLSAHADEIVINDFTGKPTQYVDGMEITKFLDQHFQKVYEEVLEEVGQSQEYGNLGLQVFVGEDQGPRPKMEDAFIAHMYANELVGKTNERYSMIGVFDGHGGAECSGYIEQHLHMNLMNDEDFPDSMEEALREAFLSTNERFFVYQEREACNPSVGATGVLSVLTKNKLWVAWAGDSEVALIKKDAPPVRVCTVHKASLESEQERIKEKGGFVSSVNGVARVCGALAVSRAFGDLKYRQYVTSEPDIEAFDIDGSEEYLVVACDGLWDVMNENDIAEFLRSNHSTTKEQLAHELVMHARSLGSTDNITAIVVYFEPK